MLRLHQYTLALVVWLSFLFNVERLDIGGEPALNLHSVLYLYVAGTVVVALVGPLWARLSLSAYSAVAVPLYIAVRVADARPVWGGAETYIFLFEVGSVVLSLWLAHAVGRRLADFLETVSALLLEDSPNSVYTPQEAEAWIRREMQYARREHYPLSVVVVEVQKSDRQAVVHQTARELLHLLARRYELVALTRLLAWRIRRTDFLLDRSPEGKLVLVAPKAHQDQTPIIVERLQKYARQHLGITLRCGAATFPAEGLTFDEIVHRAEQKLIPEVPNRVQGREAVIDLVPRADAGPTGEPPAPEPVAEAVGRLSSTE